MIGRIFDIKKRFKGVVTIVIDISTDEYEQLDITKMVEIKQKI